MQRREFVALLGAASLPGTAAASDTEFERVSSRATIGSVGFETTTGLLDANGEPNLAAENVAVWAESTAEAVDEDGNGDAVTYGDAEIPLVAVDGSVVGIGSILINDEELPVETGTEEFLLNVYDDLLGGGTVLIDEGHDQFWTSENFSKFVGYAEDNGYTVETTTAVADDVGAADAVVITSPSASFTDAEKSALNDFVADGGAVFLHSQGDYNDFDETDNLNDLASGLDLTFRFNDGQIVDSASEGPDYVFETANFNTDFPFFEDREGISPPEPVFEVGESYTGEVVSVDDGDTFDVAFENGTEETIRVLGIDTPETAESADAETPAEWEGLASDKRAGDSEYPYLSEWAAEASTFAKEELSGATVTVTFDEVAGVRGGFSRLLGYVEYDATGDGTRDARFNETMVEQGYARVYDSGFTRHDQFLTTEREARAGGTGLWAESDVDAAAERRNRDVDDLFFPKPISVTSAEGDLDDERAPVAAEASASTPEASLVGLDEEAGLAVVGGRLAADEFEQPPVGDVDAPTDEYENFVFLTNVIDAVGGRESDRVFVDGGHGQFDAGFAGSAEDVAVYKRFLEGVDLTLEQVNTEYETFLSDARALLVTTPASGFTDAELSAIQSFVDDGGAVVVETTSAAPADARSNVDDLAAALGSDLRVGDAVTDAESNVAGRSELVTSENFDADGDLFSKYVRDGGDGEEPSGSTVELTFPDGAKRPSDETVTAELRLTEAPEGLAGYDLTVEVADTAVATVADARYPDGFYGDGVERSEDGSRVRLEAADAEQRVEPGAEDALLATLELSTESYGETDVTVSLSAFDGDGGEALSPSTEAGTLAVAPAKVDGAYPTDPDDDGLYEDLNGNGEVDFDDAVLLFKYKDDPAIQNNVAAYDFNDNGRIDFADIVRLFQEV